MNITMKVRVVASPLPPPPTFTGTRLTVVAREGEMTFRIVNAKKAASRETVRVDWNDGIVDEIAGDISNLEHTYEEEGVYEIEIGDDIESLLLYKLSSVGGYKPRLAHLFSNATLLTQSPTSCFREAVNLVDFDLRDCGLTALGVMAFAQCPSLRSVAGLPRGLTSLGNVTFKDCTGLSGRIDLPQIETLDYVAAGGATFSGCTGIEEIHFAKAHEESIKASRGYAAAPTLGAANATVSFDL